MFEQGGFCSEGAGATEEGNKGDIGRGHKVREGRGGSAKSFGARSTGEKESDTKTV